MRFYITIIFSIVSISIYSQTVIKMELPEQSERQLEGYALFDDALPNEMPTALTIFGYDIEGGTTPYSYKWMENEKTLGTNESIIFNPKAGNSYSLFVLDKNNCKISIPIYVDNNKNSSLDDDSIFNQVESNLTKENLSIKFDEKLIENVEFALYDSSGTLYLRKSISNSAAFKLKLQSGIYLLYLNSGNNHGVKKHLIY